MARDHETDTAPHVRMTHAGLLRAVDGEWDALRGDATRGELAVLHYVLGQIAAAREAREERIA